MSCCSKKKTDKKEKRMRKKYGPKLSTDKSDKKGSYGTNVVHPLPKNVRVSQGYVDSLMSEVILCGSCKKAFSLRADEIVGSCGGCNKMLHCGIAGKCIGPNCTILRGSDLLRLTWCYECVPKKFIINNENNNIKGDCLCQECSEEESVPKSYKRKI